MEWFDEAYTTHWHTEWAESWMGQGPIINILIE